jgi:hypothetical protein
LGHGGALPCGAHSLIWEKDNQPTQTVIDHYKCHVHVGREQAKGEPRGYLGFHCGSTLWSWVSEMPPLVALSPPAVKLSSQLPPQRAAPRLNSSCILHVLHAHRLSQSKAQERQKVPGNPVLAAELTGLPTPSRDSEEAVTACLGLLSFQLVQTHQASCRRPWQLQACSMLFQAA